MIMLYTTTTTTTIIEDIQIEGVEEGIMEKDIQMIVAKEGI
jgi:hypothetical protein